MLETALQRSILFGYIGINGGYGKEPAFLRGVDRLGCRFVADVHCVKQFICRTLIPRCWTGMDMANGHGIAKPNAFRYGLTSGRPRKRQKPGSG